MRKQKFVEVHNDYREEDTGNIAIDAYTTNDDETPGRTVAWVTPDGNVILGTNPECEADDLECSVVKEAIKEAKEKQDEYKQELIDKVIEQIKNDITKGDVTAIDELLKFCPTKNLKAYLPE